MARSASFSVIVMSSEDSLPQVTALLKSEGHEVIHWELASSDHNRWQAVLKPKIKTNRLMSKRRNVHLEAGW